jgi:hypothetical protein
MVVAVVIIVILVESVYFMYWLIHVLYADTLVLMPLEKQSAKIQQYKNKINCFMILTKCFALNRLPLV